MCTGCSDWEGDRVLVSGGTAFLVGVSSPSGGGKTTLVENLVTRLKSSVAVLFDEYDDAGTIVHPPSYRTWLAKGADYNAWQTPRLAADLEQLKAGLSVTSLDGKSVVGPAMFVVVDAPLGRAHHETGKHIDLMIYIDTPLDVAMARRILRDQYAQPEEELRNDLNSYLEYGRGAYVEQYKQVRPGCELILDGLMSPSELTDKVIEAISARIGNVV